MEIVTVYHCSLRSKNFDAHFCMSAHSHSELHMGRSLSFSTVALLPGSGKNHIESGAPDL